MFVDQVTISLKAGDGGNGITAYRLSLIHI
ncbi:hypothetical protein, partial [Staphylococcus haemolyticus]